MGDRPYSSSVDLTPDERLSLAHYLAGRELLNAHEWLEWEDVPLLDEHGYDLLVVAIEKLGSAMCRSANPPGGHDGAEVLGRVS